jgi:MtN3 and saliva related transmembrane protein
MVGYLACIFITFAYLPQCIKVWKTNNTEGLSLQTFLLVFFGMICFIIHAIMIIDVPLLLSSIMSGLMSGYINIKIIQKW